MSAWKLPLIMSVILGVVISPACDASKIITRQQAEQVVRDFEKNPNLQFKKPSEDETNPEFQIYLHFGVEYEIEEKDRKRTWSVDPVTGDISTYSDDTVLNRRSNANMKKYSENQCRMKALEYARKHYKGFISLNMQLYEKSCSGEIWTFRWHQVLPWGAHSDNEVFVDVNTWSGMITSYRADYSTDPELLTPPHNLISRDHAWQIVNYFENDPGLRHSSVDFEDSFNKEARHRSIQYEFTIGKDDSKKWWVVNALTGEFMDISDCGYKPESKINRKAVYHYTDEKYMKKAIDLARKLYSGFDRRDFRLLYNNHDKWHYSTYWRRILSSGAFTPDVISVDIDPENGKLLRYSSTRTSPCIMSQPRISLEKAERIAIEKLDLVSLIKFVGPELISTPEILYWSFMVGGVDSTGIHRCCEARVDAMNSEFIFAGEFATSCEQTDPAPIRDILVKDSSVHWFKLQGAKLIYKGKSCILIPGSDKIEYDGRTTTLKDKIGFDGDKLFVPLNLFSLISGN